MDPHSLIGLTGFLINERWLFKLIWKISHTVLALAVLRLALKLLIQLKDSTREHGLGNAGSFSEVRQSEKDGTFRN